MNTLPQDNDLCAAQLFDRESHIQALEDTIGHHFRDREILELALTHSSFANERDCPCEHNERLEFLGDAVLELAISRRLFRSHPELREGALTKMRSRLVSTGNLAKMAQKIHLDVLLKLGRGEEQQGGRKRDSVLSDTFEAVLASVYEDGGFEAADRMVEKIFAKDLASMQVAVLKKDNKSLLQEVLHQRFKAMPVYTLTETSGPEHARTYVIKLQIPDGRSFTAKGSSYKKAQQKAAELALMQLGCEQSADQDK